MSQFVSAASLGIVALAATCVTVGAARANEGGGMHIASPGAAGPARRDQAQLVASPKPADPSVPGGARVTFSRAADHAGRPVLFSRSGGGGAAGLVSFSSRRLPASAVFSVALRPPRGALAASSGARLVGAMPSAMPVSARALTSGFGMRQHPILGTLRAHSGIDLAASHGSPIVATSDGVVNTADWAGGYGLLVSLDHGSGLQTRYGHMSRLAVVPGQPVRKGDVIGYVGSTGRSTGPHLHYEIRVNGQAVNPAGHLHGR